MLNLQILLSFSLLFSNAWAGGVQVGNGGNLVQCQGETSFQSLDFVLTRNLFGKNVRPANTTSSVDSFLRISKLLHEKIPAKANSFDEFISQVRNQDEAKKYTWHPAPFTSSAPTEIVHLPYHCSNGLGYSDIQQAIVRKVYFDGESEKIHFEFDTNLVDELQKRTVVQFSFLIVHEWIWNFTNDPVKNRKLDYFLHSTLFDKMTKAQVHVQMKVLGFDLN